MPDYAAKITTMKGRFYEKSSCNDLSIFFDARDLMFNRCIKSVFNVDIDVFASSKEIIKSEDGFQVVANKIFAEFNLEEYSCLVLPGILNPIPALFDGKNIEFLKSLIDKDILISNISSSPILLAKAGLLDDIHFTSGIFDEVCQHLDFIPYQNIIHQPIVKDKNFITAIGFAYREFAIETIRALGIDQCEGGLFNGVTREYTEEELTFKMGADIFKQFMNEYNSYIKKQEINLKLGQYV